MKFKKQIIICAFLVLVMLCVMSASSATDESLNENLTMTDDGGEIISDVADDHLMSSDSEDKLSEGNTITVEGGGEGKIAAAVSGANSGDTIVIKKGEYTEPKIDGGAKQLNFVGEDGVIIKSSATNGFFASTSDYGSLTFSKLTFQGISSGSSGSINIGGSGNVNINDCTFDGCKSKYGAMRIFTSGVVSIENVKIINCNSTSTNGASAIELAGSGSQAWSIKNLYIENSYAGNNNFGVLYLNSNTHDYNIENLTIINSSGLVYGAVYTKGNANINGSKISNNNLTRSNAGVIYLGGKDKTVKIETSEISLNTATYFLTANVAGNINLNYNNIQENTPYTMYGSSLKTNLDANYWGSNSLPEGITASSLIVENDGLYELDGTPIDVIIPGLNDQPEPEFPSDVIYVAVEGSDENDGSEESPVANITKAIELAKAGSGVIVIKEGNYTQNGIVIDGDKNITIIGQGIVIINGTGLDSGSIFTVETNNVTFRNINFADNTARYGPAIYVSGASKTDLLDINIVIENCNFNNLIATSRGGAIYAYYTKGNLKIINSVFNNLKASSWGGAICAAQSAYDTGLNVEISKSTFSNNQANNGGALYMQVSDLTVTDTDFFNNKAEQSPGAIYLTNVTASFDNCKIYNSSALKEASAIAISAGQLSTNPTVLKASEITITNCIIENNTATQDGAAAIYVTNSNMNISYSSIVNSLNILNTIVSTYGEEEPGNVIANNNWWGVNNPTETVSGKNIAIDKWVILNIQANASEVLVDDQVKITVDFNHVNTTSGEIEELTGGVIPKTYTVTLTSASGTIEPATVELTQGDSKDVIYTVADVDAIVSAQSEEAISTISFAKGVEPYYGVIYVSKDGDDKNNGSEEYPVATIAKAVELALVSKGSGQIIINEGTYNGTDYHVTGNLTVTGKGNVILDAEEKGRLFYMVYGDNANKLEISNITIINVKHSYGAAVYSRADELILNNIIIRSASGAGSLIYNTGKMSINYLDVSNHNGGNVIESSGNYNLVINNSIFTNNKVPSDYGIIYISSGKGDLTIENSKFINSTTKQSVVHIGTSDKNLYVKSSEFINNTMEGSVASGGAINANNKIDIFNSTFIRNIALGDGGAINIGRFGDATITHSVFINNAAGSGKRGDAIYNGKKLTINYCVILSEGNNKVLYHNGEDNDVNAQYNWWGTNDSPASLIGLGTYEDEYYDEADCVVDYSNWVVMTVSNNLTSEVNIDDKVEFTVDFTNTNTEEKLAELIPEVEVSASAINGEIDSEKLTTENNVAKFTYTAIEGGEDTFTITSSNAVNTTAINVKVPVVLEVIYVSMNGNDNNNGTRSSPVATIQHAIDIAQRGKIVLLEGNYTIDATIKLEKDMDIKGEGIVIVNGNKTKIFNNYANLNLTNIQFINASSAVGSIIDNQDLTNVFINGCEFYSNAATGTTGGIIHIRKGSLNLNNSKFYDNTIKRGVVSATADTTITISNSEFFNHVTTQMYGLIKLEGVDAVIENTTFRNNSVGNGAGIYITSSKTGKIIRINNNTFIDNKANSATSGNGAAIFISITSGSTDLSITNSTFIRNNATLNGGAIYSAGNNANVKVDGCTFINNTANAGNSIYVGAGKFNISNSVILNDNGAAIDYYNQVNLNNVIVNDNFWGDNTKPNVADGIKYDSWIIMNASYTTSEEGVLTITASFDKTNSTTGVIADYAGKLPDGFTVTFTSSSGKLNENVEVKEGKASVDYTRDDYEDNEIIVKSVNAENIFKFAVKPSVIYVSTRGNDNNDGDKETPVASLEQALKLAAKGQIVIEEGTYKTGNLGIISDDLTITGEGKVIIDAENSNSILYVGEEAKVVLKNLILVNGFASEESGALLGNSNELAIINCTLANSSAGENNGGAIYNVGKLTIINSTIANNVARLGGAIFANNKLVKGASITIENSIIENNTANGDDNSGGGAIFAQQLSGLTITNTTFKNNKALTTSSGGAIFISHSDMNAVITDSKFIANHANGKQGTGGGAIYFTGVDLTPYRTGTLTVSNTLFEDNSADTNGGAIYSRASNVKVENSAFINNTDENGIAVYGYKNEQVAPSVTANKNWWGTNDDPSSFIGGSDYKPTVSNWAILTITNDTEITDGNTVKVIVAIDSYTDGETVYKLDKPISVNIPVTISTNKGDIDGVLTDGEFSYDLDTTGIKFISAKVDGVEEVLYADTVATIITFEDITASKGDNVEYTITVTSADGTTVDKGIVEVYFGNDLIKTINVENGIAKENIIIAKDEGKYNVTAKFIDTTGQFANNESNKTLTVTGVNNVVTPETFNNFFDENGVLRSDVPFDEITFKGTFENIGVITINKAIKLIGDNAQFINASFKLESDNIELTNVNIVLDKNFDETDGAAVYIGGNNVVVSNNNITYNSLDNKQSYAITVDAANDVKITNNIIKFTAKSEGDVKTMAIEAHEADNLIFEQNKVEANIPSVSIGYSAYPIINYYSQGVHIENSANVSFNKNDITINYNDVKGADDTIYAVHIAKCDDSRITDNTIELNGHMYAYGLVTNDCNNITVSGNDIQSNSDDHYAAGLQVGGDSTAKVENNNISAKSKEVSYPVYLDDWDSESEVNVTNNNIKGESDTVYGIYVEENKTLISDNTIDVSGNHVYGIVTHQTDAIINGNDITANGKDDGSIVSAQSGVNENTTGIIVSEGSAQITNNNVITNGNSAITAINTNATVENNGLTANGTTAGDTIKNINSDVTSANNTKAKEKSDDTPVTPQTPSKPVVKISAKNNAKVDYGFGFTVRVTENGKSVGAGKQVTLKIAGKTLKARTNANGYAKFNLAVKPKAYTVIVAYNGISQKYKVTVKNVIKAKNLKVKKSAKKLKVKVTLKTSGKKPIKGKKVTLKIKGKKITVKTNKKGVATFTLKKSILKKLKAGKKYKYTVTYGKDTVKKTLKVKK